MSASNHYDSKIVHRAQQHYAAGWKLSEITRLIEREYGRKPHWRTVKAWVSPEWHQKQRERMRAIERRSHSRRVGRKFREVSDEWKVARMQELYGRGVGLRAIGQVAAVWWDEELSESQVLRRLGIKRGEVVRKISDRRVAA